MEAYALLIIPPQFLQCANLEEMKEFLGIP